MNNIFNEPQKEPLDDQDQPGKQQYPVEKSESSLVTGSAVDQSGKKQASMKIPIYPLIGLLFAVASLPSLALLTWFIFFEIFGEHDYFLICGLSLLPAIAAGLFSGRAGATLVDRRFKRLDPFFGAAAGGLAAAMMIVFAVEVANSLVRTAMDLENEARVEAYNNIAQSIPPLGGSFHLMMKEPHQSALTVSPDSQLLAVAHFDAHFDRIIDIWDIKQQKHLRQINVDNQEPQPIYHLAFSPDNRWLLSGGEAGKMNVWSVLDGKLVFETQESFWVITSLAVSPDGSLAVSGHQCGYIFLWDLVEGKEITTLEDGKDEDCITRIEALEFSPDGKLLLASWSNRDKIALYDVSQHQAVGKLDARANDLSFNSDGSLIAGTGDYGTHIWDVKTLSLLGEIEYIEGSPELHFSPDGNWFAITSDSIIYIFDTATRMPVGKLINPSASTSGVNFSPSTAYFLPDGRLLAYYEATDEIGFWTLDNP